MGQKVFIPITDEMLYDHPELITAPLKPFNIDNPCYHWMANAEIEIIEEDKPTSRPTS